MGLELERLTQDDNEMPSMRDKKALPSDALHSLLLWALENHIEARPCDESIGELASPYMQRWHIIRKEKLLDVSFSTHLESVKVPFVVENAYVHRFLRSDDDRALHDHPWPWMSILLDGEYLEHRPLQSNGAADQSQATPRQAGSIAINTDASLAHRIELTTGNPVTLFLTGYKTREWGFWCGNRWVHWRQFTELDDSGYSRGCN